MNEGELKKVVFELEVIDGWPPVGTESVWAAPQRDGAYRLDNIPFFASDATLDDVVRVRDLDGKLFFAGVADYSGNSLIRLFIESESKVGHVQQLFQSMGCTSEWSSDFNIVALNVPPTANLPVIQSALMEGKSQGKWDYEEPLLHAR